MYLGINLAAKVENEHEYDAYLCAVTAKRFSEEDHDEFGEEEETIILPTSDE